MHQSGKIALLGFLAMAGGCQQESFSGQKDFQGQTPAMRQRNQAILRSLQAANDFAKKGKWAEAQVKLEGVLRVRPSHPLARLDLARVLSQRGMAQRAFDTYTQAISQRPPGKNVLWNLDLDNLYAYGIACDRLGKTQLAEEAFRDLLLKVPEEMYGHPPVNEGGSRLRAMVATWHIKKYKYREIGVDSYLSDLKLIEKVHRESPHFDELTLQYADLEIPGVIKEDVLATLASSRTPWIRNIVAAKQSPSRS